MEITRWDPRPRRHEDSPVTAGEDKILDASMRLLYRMQHTIPAIGDYDRMFGHALCGDSAAVAEVICRSGFGGKREALDI